MLVVFEMFYRDAVVIQCNLLEYYTHYLSLSLSYILLKKTKIRTKLIYNSQTTI